MKRRPPSSAFTLVELLVVIAIIGILMGLLIPAVNAAREAARKNQCAVYQKNFALAAVQHENSKGRLPAFNNKFGVFEGGADPTDPALTNPISRHVKVGGFGIALLPWLEAQPTFEHWTEDRYPILTDGSADIAQSSSVGGSGFGAGFHELAAPNLAIFQCPSNPRSDADQGRNSYISNNGLALHQPNPDVSSDDDTQSNGVRFYANVGTGTDNREFFKQLRNKNNTTHVFGYVGGKIGSGTEHAFLSEGPKITLDDLKDGQGFTALYSENVQAMPWYLPGLVNGGDLVVAAGINDVNASPMGSDQVRFAIETSPYTAGMVWHLADNDFTGVQALNAQYAVTRLPLASYEKIRINGRGPDTSEDIFVEEMDASNFSTIARPSSAHVEGVNMGFADGATRFITTSVDYRVYQALMTPRGKSSDVPFKEFVLTDEISQ